MQLYKTFTKTLDGTEMISYQGSLTEASKARSSAKKEGFKAETQTINIPTGKAGLIEWLNNNVKS